MRFLADMGVDVRVVEWPRRQGHDAIHNTRTPHVIDRLAAVLANSTVALEKGAVLAVEESRHRVRYLPVGGTAGNP